MSMNRTWASSKRTLGFSPSTTGGFYVLGTNCPRRFCLSGAANRATGVHPKGWTREQALKYMHDYTALLEHEIETEVDRYIAWPGQALSYYMGELAILRAREKAEKTLGANGADGISDIEGKVARVATSKLGNERVSKFNIRAFHDAVLELGSVPLPVVTARIDRFIAEGGKGPYPDME